MPTGTIVTWYRGFTGESLVFCLVEDSEKGENPDFQMDVY